MKEVKIGTAYLYDQNAKKLEEITKEKFAIALYKYARKNELAAYYGKELQAKKDLQKVFATTTYEETVKKMHFTKLTSGIYSYGEAQKAVGIIVTLDVPKEKLEKYLGIKKSEDVIKDIKEQINKVKKSNPDYFKENKEAYDRRYEQKVNSGIFAFINKDKMWGIDHTTKYFDTCKEAFDTYMSAITSKYSNCIIRCKVAAPPYCENYGIWVNVYKDTQGNNVSRDRHQYTKPNVLDWLAEHEQTFQDFCNAMKVNYAKASDPNNDKWLNEFKDIDLDDIEGWIVDNDTLCQDFCNWFNVELDEECCESWDGDDGRCVEDNCYHDCEGMKEPGCPLYSGSRFKAKENTNGVVKEDAKVSKRDMEAFERVRQSGVTNMFARDLVCQLAGISKETYMEIVTGDNYSKYMEMYGISRG